MPESAYTDVTVAYQLHFNFLFGTSLKRNVLCSEVGNRAATICHDVCEGCGYHLLDIQVQGDRLEAFLYLKPEHVISHVVQMLRGNVRPEGTGSQWVGPGCK